MVFAYLVYLHVDWIYIFFIIWIELISNLKRMMLMLKISSIGTILKKLNNFHSTSKNCRLNLNLKWPSLFNLTSLENKGLSLPSTMHCLPLWHILTLNFPLHPNSNHSLRCYRWSKKLTFACRSWRLWSILTRNHDLGQYINKITF